jgi:hypothetical protein
LVISEINTTSQFFFCVFCASESSFGVKYFLYYYHTYLYLEMSTSKKPPQRCPAWLKWWDEFEKEEDAEPQAQWAAFVAFATERQEAAEAEAQENAENEAPAKKKRKVLTEPEKMRRSLTRTVTKWSTMEPDDVEAAKVLCQPTVVALQRLME